jgi:hypothetical protein
MKRIFRGGPQPVDRYVGGAGLLLYGLLLALAGLLLLSAALEVWPAVEDATPGAANNPEAVALVWGAVDLSLTKQTALIVLVLVMGALGGFVHAATSFASYAGNRTLKVSWMWWYALRLLIGAALALGFYFVISGGLFSLQGSAEQVNSYGTGAFAFLVGLFSKQAIDKLEQILEVAFSADERLGDGARRDKLADRRPVILELDPPEIRVGGPREIEILGQRFTRDVRVRFDDLVRDPRFESERKLVAEVPERLADRPGRIAIRVVDRDREDESSNERQLRVVER